MCHKDTNRETYNTSCTKHLNIVRMEESQTLKNGHIYLKNKSTIILGVSPGNPFFYRMENLVKMLQFSKTNSDKVRIHPKLIEYHGYLLLMHDIILASYKKH